MNKKELAAAAERLRGDDCYCSVIGLIKTDATSVFLNPSSTHEEREHAHKIVCGLSEIEKRIKSFMDDGTLIEHRERRQERG